MDCELVFIRKQDKFENLSLYKARAVAQGFIQHPCIDYEETHSLVMDSITFKYLLSLVVDKKLETLLMDVVTAYLYGNMDIDMCMKVPTWLVEFHNS